VARARGDRRIAEGYVQESLKIRDNPAAHFQRFLLALDRNDTAIAVSELSVVRSALADSARALELEARIQVMFKHYKDALDLYQKAAEENPRRIAYPLLAGGMAARLSNSNLTLKVARPSLDVDPASVSRKRDVTEFYEDRRGSLFAEGGSFQAASRGDEPADLLGYAGAVRYALGDLGGASRAVAEALHQDSVSLVAHLYSAQIALDHGDWDKALKQAQQAAAVEREAPLPYYLQGRAFEGKGKLEDARKMYVHVGEVAATFMPAVWRLGALLERAGQKNEAQVAFRKVVSADPDFVEARAALMRLGD
jgi:tetratricopeptide (TPR) repeat protein